MEEGLAFETEIGDRIFRSSKMRRAKQNRSDDVAERAQRMASDRSDRIAHDLNQKTNQGLDRSLMANRQMLKEAAMENSVLGRQGKAIEQAPAPSYPAQKSFLPRDETQTDRSIVGRRKTQVEPNHVGDSLPPGYRRVMNRDAYQKRNDRQPRFHPQTDARPDPSVLASSSREKGVAAYGITQNPVEDARRRKKLEAKIREMASK